MISSLLSNPLSFVIYIISLLLTISIHEFSHAYMADYLGDPTPRLKGRITLNPLAHLDLIGALSLLFFGFGWGKPVIVDQFNFKNPKKDTGLVALAGPASNILLAIALSILLKLFTLVNQNIIIIIGYYLLTSLIRINLVLGIFNLLPIYPLDGFKIVGAFLPNDKSEEWFSLQRYGYIFLILLIIPLFGSSMVDKILFPIINLVYNLLVSPITQGII